MAASGLLAGSASRLVVLQGFLEQDPQNARLLQDAIEAALAEGELTAAGALIVRAEQLGEPSPPLRNLKGIFALRERRPADAVAAFEQVFATDPDDPGVRFNLAWAKALLRDFDGANAVLDDEAALASAAAATLKVQMLHHLGALEDALAWGARLVERYPDNAGLMSALAEVALDGEDSLLAQQYAVRAGDTPQALATLGMLELAEEHSEVAAEFFDRALERSPDNPRALLGKGLVMLSGGDAAGAAPYLDRTAISFGDHLGSWIAAGWAHFAAGDRQGARAKFEHALTLDDTFSESHGALAVLDVLEGDVETGRVRAETARRLDRQSLSAALAQSLLLTHDGDPQKAQRVIDLALNQPVGPGGRTILQSMAGLAKRNG